MNPRQIIAAAVREAIADGLRKHDQYPTASTITNRVIKALGLYQIGYADANKPGRVRDVQLTRNDVPVYVIDNEQL